MNSISSKHVDPDFDYFNLSINTDVFELDSSYVPKLDDIHKS